MRPASQSSSFHFGPIRFDEHTGEIERRDGDRRSTARLSPQPARLLAHLIHRRPELVSGEEIRRLLWPDVQVEFEQSLHTCIRQIRAALDDSAAAPRWIETIPRRGYRFLGELEGEESRAQEPPAPPRRRGKRMAAVLGLLLGLALVLVALRAVDSVAAAPVRVAVMPLEPFGEEASMTRGNDLAETIVALLVAAEGAPLQVVGPTTTERYDGRPARLPELFDELAIAYVVNARPTGDGEARRVLIEIIRSDGAHVWARYLDDLPPGRAAPEAIAQAVVHAAR